MTVYLTDPDFTLYVGDVGDVLPTLPDESVDCVITSPPYWGLRDYGTGAWGGGNPDCDHIGGTLGRRDAGRDLTGGGGNREGTGNPGKQQFRDVCGKCGAQRQDQQLGLEATPAQYVARMVAVFREVRRVLAPHGTCWVNLGDSYNSGGGYSPDAPSNLAGSKQSTNAGAIRKDAYRDRNLKPKDLVGIPWRVAFALQADGWYLRADVIWAKLNPMPESVTDRPTKSHEYVFLLTKRPRYWFDQEAVREPSLRAGDIPGGNNSRGAGVFGVAPHAPFNGPVPAARNVRSVWEIATQPYPEAHFATYPEELVRRCLLAGCPEQVCRTCGKPRERIVEREPNPDGIMGRGNDRHWYNFTESAKGRHLEVPPAKILGWSDCGHNNYRPGRVLDPFLGSGTTALVARRHGRHTVGVELSTEYAQLAARRLQQLSLLAEAPA